MMKQIVFVLLITFSLVVSQLTACTGPNLFQNPSFETPVVPSRTFRGIPFSSVPGWTFEKVPSGPCADILEIMNGWAGFTPTNGQYVELDSLCNLRVSQTFTTVPGGNYLVSWKYSPRPKNPVTSDGIKVTLNNADIFSTALPSGVNTLWNTYTVAFTGTGNDKIGFEAIGVSDTRGTFFDDAFLCALPDCPAPPDQCHKYIVNTNTGNCDIVPVQDGTSCDDDNDCTSFDICTAGACAGESLLVNGNFDEPIVDGEFAGYPFNTITGWNPEIVTPGECEELLEVFGQWADLIQIDGQYIELDSLCNVRIRQTVQTIPGSLYVTSFYYSPGRGDLYPLTTEGVKIKWNDLEVDSVARDGTTATNFVWEQYSYTVVATGIDDLSFEAIGTSDSHGGFFDKVTLCEVKNCPPPIDQCHSRSYDIPTKTCTYTPLSDTPCDDGDSCSLNDKCQSGVCKGEYLVQNPSFETPVVADPFQGIPFSSLTGWTAQTLKAGCPELVELIRQTFHGYKPYSGDQFVELDSLCNIRISQTITTSPSKFYNVTFAYSPRPTNPAVSDGVRALWNGVEKFLISLDGTGLSNTDWKIFSFFVAGTGSDELSFEAIGTSDTRGTFFEFISICEDPTVCLAPDQCHSATIDPSGACIAVPLDGDDCTDSDECTLSDICQAGVCVSGTTKDCPASDQCHRGVCDTQTGDCSNVPIIDGTPCNDGHACTQTDSCHGGSCVGENPRVCLSDECNQGVCDDQTGDCSSVPKTGTPCNDGNACTQTDTCQAGSCVGTTITCTPLNQCHQASCDSIGGCSSVPKTDGTLCNDGNACTQTDTCQAGSCVGSDQKECPTPLNDCLNPGQCDSQSGQCSYLPKSNGSPCNDLNSCTSPDTCQNGQCNPDPNTPNICCKVGNKCGGCYNDCSAQFQQVLTDFMAAGTSAHDVQEKKNGCPGKSCCTPKDQNRFEIIAGICEHFAGST